MTPTLILSLALNATLLAALFFASRRIRAMRPRPLPRIKPDFAAIENEIVEILKQPEYAPHLSLVSFEARVWICQVKVLHVDAQTFEWSTLEDLVRTVSQRIKIPGRPAGWHCDDSRPPRYMGSTLEFGYSPEVGYAHPNEFYEDI
jgi:hypothetical protein